MRTFRQYLAENDYPGAYYTPDMKRLIKHFNTKEEKEKWDAENPNADPNDEFIFRSDKSPDVKKLLGSTRVAIARNITQPLVAAASRAALGEGIFGDIPIESFENNIRKLEDELVRVREQLRQINAAIEEAKTEERKNKLKKLQQNREMRYDEVYEKWKNWQDRNAK